MDVYKPVYAGLYYFDTFTFTTLGASGNRGPTSDKTYANAPWRDGDFSIVNGQQQWTVPATGTYHIEAAGAYGATPGRVVSGDVDLNEGQAVKMLVGQQPTPLTSNIQDNLTVGGGGGSFVTVDGKPLIVASGGDGGIYSPGYLVTTTIPTSTDVPISASMSANGNTMAIVFISVMTFQISVSVYQYISGAWTRQAILNSNPNYNQVKISGNGQTIVVSANFQFTGDVVEIFEYMNGLWSEPQLLEKPEGYTSFGQSIDISADGFTLITNASYDSGMIVGWVGVYTKNENLTWNSPIPLSPFAGSVFGKYVAVSGDGMKACVSSLSNVAVYSNQTWDEPSIISDNTTTMITMNYDGSVIATCIQDSLLNIPIYIFVNDIQTATFEVPSETVSTILQLSSDGSVLLVAQSDNTFIYKSPAWTNPVIITIAAGESAVASAMNSTGTRVLKSFVSFTSSLLNVYNLGASAPASFLPSGTGSGISGAGYLTDGQVSNPFLFFLKPNAYINGGFGNSYLYGQPELPEQGGFGGGQSPIGLLTELTSITGYKQVRPSIPLTLAVFGIALSGDANTFLVCTGQPPTSFVTNVYQYADSQWTTQILDDQGFSPVSLSSDGTVWLIGVDVWRNGTKEITLEAGNYHLNFTQGYAVAHHYSSSISGDGNTVVLTIPRTEVSTAGRVYGNVYTYSSGSWSYSATLPLWETSLDITSLQSAVSYDGTVVAMGMASYATNLNPSIWVVNVYRFVNGIWSAPETIYTSTTGTGYVNIGNLSISSDGSTIVFGAREYSNGVLSELSLNISNTKTFSKTEPTFYAYADNTQIYIPAIPTDVTVAVNKRNYFIAMGSNILATCDLYDNQTIVFVDMYDPTTTCTANTAVDHGYPHDYKVQITGTNSFNGTWDIVTATANTFTFQAFGGPTETTGYVSGTTTGISGGGGYTGSPGDGVSGATCYADSSVKNFTDLGAASNSAGYVNVSIIDPVPIKEKWVLTTTLNIYKNDIGFLNYRSIAWGSSSFVAVPNDGSPILYSIDGLQWNKTLTYGSWKSVTYGNGMFVAVGDDNAVYSSDGITWTVVNTGIPMNHVTYGNDKFVAVAFNKDIPVMYSTDKGKTWSTSTSGISKDSWSSVTYGNGTFVIVSNTDVAASTYPVAYSSDGVTWFTTTSGAPIDTWISVTYGNGKFVAITNAGIQYAVMYSADGQTWSTSTTGITAFEFGTYVMWDETKFIATGSSVPWYSFDGISWTKKGSVGNASLWSFAFSKPLGLYVGLPYNISIDGILWIPSPSKLTVSTNGFYNGIAESNELGLFVTAKGGGNGDSVYFKNGEFNTTSSLLAKSITWSQELGLFIAVNTDWDIPVYYSNDGISWFGTNSGIPEFTSLYCVMWCQVYAIFICVTGSDIYSSRDGKIWLLHSTIPYSGWLLLAASESRIVCISHTLYGGTVPIAFSDDGGSTWSTSTTGITADTWNSVSYGNGMFVTVSDSGYIAYSHDGSDWKTISLSGSWICVTWSEDLGIFFAIEPNHYAYSSDAIHWTVISFSITLSMSVYPPYFCIWSSQFSQFVVPITGGIAYITATKTF